MLWVKALHIISMVAWFAGLFYLPRLFVYHSLSSSKETNDTFKIMEKKLYKIIIIPASIVTIASGTIMLYAYAWNMYKHCIWLHIKLLFVLFLLAFQHVCGHFIRKFANELNSKNEKFFRFFNEIPTIILVGIILMVVLKPS